MLNRLGQTVRDYLRENQSLYLFTIVLLGMGIIFGALLVHSLGYGQRQELLSFLQFFFTTVENNGIFNQQAQFQQSFGTYLKLVGMIWLFGLSIIGLPIILVLLFLKGVVVGFTVGFLVHQLQWQGVVFSLAGVLPQNMLAVPALVIAGVAGISFSLKLIRTRLLARKGDILPYFMSYTLLTFVMFGVLTMAALFETYVSPHLMKYALS